MKWKPEGPLSESLFKACSLQGEELERFKQHSGNVRLADDKTLDIASIGDVVLKTSFAHVNKRGSLYMVELHLDGIGAIINGSGSADVRKVDIYFYKPGGLEKQKDLSFIMSVKTRKLQRLRVAFGVAERLSRTFRSESMRLRVEALKMLWEDSSPRGSSNTSDGSKNSGSFEDSGRSDEEYSKDGASSKEGGSETLQWKKVINEEIISLKKNQTCSLVRLPVGKKVSLRLWMFKVKEEQDGSKRYKARLVVKGFQQKQGDVHQVGDEIEVKVLRNFNWPLSELIMEDGVLPERGYSQFNDVYSGYLVSKVS
uniref:Retrovirus-related Pol polyprotein from transposon TNT 1-94 n=1 Tax=Tanacetum cinerariifolium TaxID=118510 RepID=A0A6L2JK84_TANCI|nr:retrovirus-related Pol polyprotein from transposon TNT 1-94 [Tanacetum cinerariifolium]